LHIRLLFVTYTDRNKVKNADFEDPHKICPLPMARNLANIWAKYPQYSEENTVLISNFFNEIEDFQRNDIVLPVFAPKVGRTDFLDDMHLDYAHSYLRFMLSLDGAVGPDVRMRMEAYGYEQYCQRINKNLKYDSRRDPQSDYF